MTAEQAFSIANTIAIAGWLLLIAGSRRRWVHTVVAGAILPLLFAVLYTGLVLAFWGSSEGGFGSLAEVGALFGNPWILLAGWIHYLAFDLFVGSREARDAAEHGISRWALIPCLILTFLFGPAGLLAYAAVRTLALRSLKLPGRGQV